MCESHASHVRTSEDHVRLTNSVSFLLLWALCEIPSGPTPSHMGVSFLSWGRGRGGEGRGGEGRGGEGRGGEGRGGEGRGGEGRGGERRGGDGMGGESGQRVEWQST